MGLILTKYWTKSLSRFPCTLWTSGQTFFRHCRENRVECTLGMVAPQAVSQTPYPYGDVSRPGLNRADFVGEDRRDAQPTNRTVREAQKACGTGARSAAARITNSARPHLSRTLPPDQRGYNPWPVDLRICMRCSLPTWKRGVFCCNSPVRKQTQHRPVAYLPCRKVFGRLFTRGSGITYSAKRLDGYASCEKVSWRFIGARCRDGWD